MTQIPPSKSSSSPTEPGAALQAGTEPRADAGPAQQAEGPDVRGMIAKGCGWTLLAIVLGIGVAMFGHGEIESWGSALVGVIFLILIMGTSGLTGWWNK